MLLSYDLCTKSRFLPLVLPGIAFLLSRYYKRQELIARIGFFLALSPSLSGAFGGLLASAGKQSAKSAGSESRTKRMLWCQLLCFNMTLTLREPSMT